MAETQLDEYLHLKSIPARHSEFTEPQLRWLVVKSKENGLEKAIRRVGRRIYFHMPTFLHWLEAQKS